MAGKSPRRVELRICDQRRGTRIIEALARHADKGDLLLPPLHRRFRGYDRQLMEALECFLVELAGRMRLAAAIPIVVERLQEGDLWLNNSCTTSLQWIGGDAVAQSLTKEWPSGDGDFRRSAAETLQTIHTDFSVEKLLAFFAAEKDEEARHFLANALLRNFVPEAVPLIRPLVLGRRLTPDENDLRLHLVAASTIMNATFPEYDAWFREGEKSEWGWGHQYAPDRIRQHFQDKEEGDKSGGEGFDDDWEDEVAEDDEDEKDRLDSLPAAQPVRRDQPPLGRNDPCPCGSGKKYEKCCLGKQRRQDQGAQPKFPLGTIALYGPDAEYTTKITASVIKRVGAEPILRRWVGSNVKDNPKVQRELLEFFRKHGAKSVVTTEQNIGCPHEEGEDFPVGGDCPFCPYWKGKQGSGAH